MSKATVRLRRDMRKILSTFLNSSAGAIIVPQASNWHDLRGLSGCVYGIVIALAAAGVATLHALARAVEPNTEE